MNGRGLTIAIDGPSAAGKGSVARGVARALGYQYIDTGAMYRAVALFAREAGLAWSDEPGVASLAGRLSFRFHHEGDVLRIVVDGRDVTEAIRTAAIGRGASDVSALPAVRAALLGLQRSLGAAGGVVLDGRDIGTVVLPHADLKVFLDADLGTRAERRHAELVERGQAARLDDVRTAIAARDRQDRERTVAPLTQADDAVYLDTTDLTIETAVDAVLALARALDAPSGTE